MRNEWDRIATRLVRSIEQAADPCPRQVRVVLTEPARHFWERSPAYAPEAWQAFQALPEPIPVLRDADEWAAWDELGDRVVHIELREWADVLLVAPLSANSLAKLAHGMCDNLLVRSEERRKLHAFTLQRSKRALVVIEGDTRR